MYKAFQENSHATQLNGLQKYAHLYPPFIHRLTQSFYLWNTAGLGNMRSWLKFCLIGADLQISRALNCKL